MTFLLELVYPRRWRGYQNYNNAHRSTGNDLKELARRRFADIRKPRSSYLKEAVLAIIPKHDLFTADEIAEKTTLTRKQIVQGLWLLMTKGYPIEAYGPGSMPKTYVYKPKQEN